MRFEPLGDAGADLRRIAVDRLLAGKDDVAACPRLRSIFVISMSQRVSCRKRVGAGKEAIREQHRAVRAEGEALRRLSRPSAAPW